MKHDGTRRWAQVGVAAFAAFMALGAAAASVGCHAQANASVGGRDDLEGNASANASTDTPKETTAPPPAQSSDPVPVTATAPPPAAACPFVCTEHDGAAAHPLAADDNERLRVAFAGPMNDLRQCAPQGWQRRGSPTYNLRFDGKGVLADVGLDLTGYDGNEEQCLQSVPHPSPDVSYPGPADVRCTERCATNASVRRAGKHKK